MDLGETIVTGLQGKEEARTEVVLRKETEGKNKAASQELY